MDSQIAIIHTEAMVAKQGKFVNLYQVALFTNQFRADFFVVQYMKLPQNSYLNIHQCYFVVDILFDMYA